MQPKNTTERRIIMSAKLRKSGEDYLEAILDISKTSPEVRSIDIANKLNVSRPSVNRAIGKLKDQGFIEQEPYGSITLTESGEQRAMQVRQRHSLISGFLTNVLGVNPKVAEEDACKMEHEMSDETIIKLAEYYYKILNNKGNG